MIDLNYYGWNDKLNQLKQESTYGTLTHGRVTIVHRTCYEVVAGSGVFRCELTGNMMYGKSDFELPCTGDWVIFQPFDEGMGIIVDMLPRSRTLCRRKIGTVAEKQAIAAHVDKAFIVQSLDDNFNVRRAERFMVQMREENITSVLVLNKADLGFDQQKVEEQIRHVIRQIPVFYTSIHESRTIFRLREFIAEGETVVFVGSSGVGKSSLVNALCEKSVLLTFGISQSTGKGRHTSTRREMVLMDGGGVLIDTPGVREFGLAVDDPGALDEILEIADYAQSCRFKDCEHINEPGCAVLDAVSRGILDRQVYESYLKLRRETWHFSASEHEKRKKEKSFTKLVDEVNRLNPDLIVFTGDMVNSFASEMDPWIETLKKLKAKYGKYATTGNHDYGTYVKWSSKADQENNLKQFFKNMERADFTMLNNTNIPLVIANDTLYLAGVENWGLPPFPCFGKLAQALEGTNGYPVILLSHDPSHWRHEVLNYPVDLMLAGHTHAMQLGINIGSFRWSPAVYIYPEYNGLYTANGQQLYVSRGVGYLGFAGRIGQRPEITLIKLTNDCK